MGAPEFWTMGVQHQVGDPGTAGRQAEAEGWDGVAFTDTWSTAVEVFVAMTLAVQATDRIKVASYVTNPSTRHPAVVASALASLQRESGGRIVGGIGRGDSALAHVGMRPAPVAKLRSYVAAVQAYLRGEQIPFSDLDWDEGADIAGLPSGERPMTSTLQLIADGTPFPKPEVFVAASGPQVIRIAAQSGDRVLLAVGADPDRVRAGVEIARSIRPDVPISVFVNVVTDVDPDRGFAIISRGLAGHARFSAMHGSTSLAAGSQASHRVFEGIAAGYSIVKHGRGADYGDLITPEFAQTFGIYGSPGYCVDRLGRLAELGVDRFHVLQGPRVAPQFDADKRAANDRFVSEVVPALRG